MPSRRRLLGMAATGLSAVLAGCNVPTPSSRLTMTAVDGATLATELSDELEAARLQRDTELLEAAVDENEQAIERFATPSYRPDHPIPFDGSYYRLSWNSIENGVWIDAETVTDADTAGGTDDGDAGTATEGSDSSGGSNTNATVSGSGGGNATAEDADASGTTAERTITFEELPEADQKRVDTVLSQLTRGAFGTVERLVEYDEAARDSSGLVPDQQYDVVIAKDRAPADSVRLRVRPADGTVYLADARERSISDATYGEQLREYYGVQFDSLSTAERGIVEEAIDSEYTPESDDGDEESGDGGSDETNSSDDGGAEGSEEHPFESIAKRLVDKEPVVSTEQQSWWPVLYDGETYLTSLELVGYPDLERRLDRHEATPGRRHGRPAPTNEDDGR